MDQELERLVRQRAGRICEYCHMLDAFDLPAFELEHIIARKHQGKTVAGNLAVACFTCNHHKGPNLGGIDPKTGKKVWLFHPRRHKWAKHFRWDGPILLGRTPTGRATIAVLGINLPLRIRLRAELIKEGIFLPA